MAKKSHPVVREPSPSSEEEEEEEEEEGEEEEGEEGEEEEGEEEEKEEGEEVVEEEEKEEESEDDEESEDSKATPVPTSSVRNETSDQVQNSNSDDSGSGSGSETDSDSDSPSPVKPRPPSGVLKADLHVKPLASIPIDNAKTEAMAKVKGKGVAYAKAPEPAPTEKTKSAAAAAKRPSEEDLDAKVSHPKKARTEVLDTAMGNRKNGVAAKPPDDSKRQLFQRLWSEDDEVALLEGVIEFTGKTGAIPSGDMKPFHDFIKKSFHFEASTIQLSEKLRRLKLKYKNNSAKAAKKGAEIKFSKAHDQICYDLSKKVWGNVTDNSEAAEQQTKSNRTGPVAARKDDFGSGSLGGMGIMTDLHGAVVAAGSFGEDILRQGLAHIGDSWSPSFERKWKDLQVEDMKLYLRRIGLIQEMIKLVMDSYYD